MKKPLPLREPIYHSLKKILLIMRFSIILLILGIMQAFANDGYSQKTRLSLNFSDTELNKVLDVIEKESEFYFLFNEKLIDSDRKISITIEDQFINTILDNLFADTDVKYTIINRKIILAPEYIFQQSVITGIVNDENGQPIPGVNVQIEGTTIGAITDTDGKYSIVKSNDDIVLIFSFVGYNTERVAASGKTTINIILTPSTISLDEVVVVGYGTQKKVNLTGALSTISSDELENRPISSTAQGLQGLIPNLNITFRDGDPADGSVDFNIRGYESINGGNPLILVDDIPMDLQKINPNDIESITVLKDAAAAAIYGARAAFGVVLVTTKSGAKAKEGINIQYSYNYEHSKPIMKFDLPDNSYTYAIWKNKSAVRADGTALYTDRFVDAVKAYYEDPKNNPEWAIYDGTLEFYGYNNWKDILVKNSAPAQKHNLSITGNSERTNYYVSFGSLNKDGFLKVGNDNFKRYNILMKAEFKVFDWLTLDEKVTINVRKTDGPTDYYGDYNSTIVRPVPLVPNKFPKIAGYEELEGYNIYINTNILGLNTNYAQLERGGRVKSSNFDSWLTTGMTLNPVKNLIFRMEYSINIGFSENESVINSIAWANSILTASEKIIYDPLPEGSRISNDHENTNYQILNVYSEYTLNKGKHYAKATVGFNQEYLYAKYVGATAYGLLSPNLPDLNLTKGIQETSGARSELALRGAFYRINYIFDDRYLFEANGRYDGSSRFPKDDRFSFFPSFSAGWRISNESFMEPLDNVINNLKFRASYGSLGNQQVGSYYPYIPSMGVGLSSWLFNSSGQRFSMTTPPGLVSSTLTWETVVSKNLGVDFTLLGNKIDGSFDIFTRDTKDMLMNAVYPIVLGASAPKVNGADLRTSGWEFSLTWLGKVTRDLTFNASFSIGDSHSEITKYTNVTGTLTDYYVGQKIGEIWGYTTAGIFQTDEEVTNSADQSQLGSNWRPGDIHYADIDESGEINPGSNTLTDHGDLSIIGNSSPRYNYGLNLNIHYKNVALNTFFQGIGKRDYWPRTSGNGTFWPFGSNTSFEMWMIDESWSEDNRDAYFYYPNRYAGQNQAVQTRFMQNSSYIRLKNITLSYTIPQKITSNVGIDKVDIYFSGQNLWEYSKIHRPFDPEMVSTNYLEYPFQRIYSFGVSVSF